MENEKTPTETKPFTPPPAPDYDPEAQIKILVVDDDTNLRETLAELLEMEGYATAQAANGQECVEMVEREFFNLILMDYNLPDETGLNLIKKIRSFNAETQIIMVTAYASLNAMIKAMHEAVYDFLIKPVDFDYLKRTIGRALEKYRLEQKNRDLFRKLQVSNDSLKKMDNMKSKFFSIVSHDLSNSLMGLKMSFDMLYKSAPADEEQQKKIGYMHESIDQMSHLIKDLVDWAAMERGKLRITPKPFNLTLSVKNLSDVFREKAKLTKGVSVSFEADSDTTVLADEKRIKQVVNNLLENAVRHSEDLGKVEIKIKKFDEKNARVSVKDNGDGIAPENVSGLFDSFSQVDGNSKKGRLGLGLSISKEIVQNHGGRIWAESDGLGKGTTFHFTLPMQLY